MREIKAISIDVAIIGAGPAGLMAADILSSKGIKVHLFDAMPTAGRKLLMAGKSGLNISHAEDFESFLEKYGNRKDQLAPALRNFNAKHIKDLMTSLGEEFFVGTSGRIFPKVMKSSSFLRKWLLKLAENGVTLQTGHKWTGWNEDGDIIFHNADKDTIYNAKATILALGGASWPRLGSDAAWVDILAKNNIKSAPLEPSNCGFNVNWSEHFLSNNEGLAVSNVTLSLDSQSVKGSFVVTKNGVEGGSIYTLSSSIRDKVKNNDVITINVDLTPDRSLSDITNALSKQQGRQSMSSHIRKSIGLKGVKAQLLREFLPKDAFNDAVLLAEGVKALPMSLGSPRPIDEAISSAGGISFDGLLRNMPVRKMIQINQQTHTWIHFGRY